METYPAFDKCLAFINCQLQPAKKNVHYPALAHKPAVTISRQSGCGAHAVAEKLAEYLQARSTANGPPWTLFDRNLVERVLTEHNLPERLARFMPEDRTTELDDIMDEVFGLHPPSLTLVHQTAETILRLTDLGNVIILGRGANVITAKLPGVVHVRLVAPLEKRIENMCEFERLDRRAARARIQREDLGRKRYLRKYFSTDADDPLAYHLVINTGLVSLDDAARLIGDLVLAGQAE